MKDYIRITSEEMDDIALEASKNKITLDETGNGFKNSFGNVSWPLKILINVEKQSCLHQGNLKSY